MSGLPKKWGAGALFTYSGLEGTCTLSGGLCATLCADRVGLSFMKDEAMLYFRFSAPPEYTAVTGDLIRAQLPGGTFLLAFSAQDTLTGCLPEEGQVLLAGWQQQGEVYKGESGYYALVREGARFGVGFSPVSGEAAQQKAREGCAADADAIARRREAQFNALPTLPGDELRKQTLAKCFSILRAQVYSPEGRFRQNWTTPDKLPHRYLWLWDSVFHSFGSVHMDVQLAKDTLLSVLDAIQPDGMIPHMAGPDIVSDITQPPVLAWGFWQLYRRTGDAELLADVYDRLCAYLKWNDDNRSTGELYAWKVETDKPNCRCGECGMDNSPRFDNVQHMACVDFSCFMAHEAEQMAFIARCLGRQQEARAWQLKRDAIARAVEAQLWCEEDGFYYDRLTSDGSFKRVQAVSGLLPLFAGVCSPQRAQRLVEHLQSEKGFASPALLPSIARSDATYGTDMWRGPVWMNYNYMIWLGLLRFGFASQAEALRQSTLKMVETWFDREGVTYEFYDSENAVSPLQLYRKGSPLAPVCWWHRYPAIRDYGWTASLYIAMSFDADRMQNCGNI